MIGLEALRMPVDLLTNRASALLTLAASSTGATTSRGGRGSRVTSAAVPVRDLVGSYLSRSLFSDDHDNGLCITSRQVRVNGCINNEKVLESRKYVSIPEFF